MDTNTNFGSEKISKLLLKMAPPVMLAQLIQAVYNIVDSFFIGQYGENGLTALSIIFPLQLLMIALAVGTGVGINTIMASCLGKKLVKEANVYAGIGTPLALLLWLLVAVASWFIMPSYAYISTSSPAVIEDVITYGRIVCVFGIGLFLESIWTKVLQAEGDMKTPMYAQIAGAVTNIVLDPILIFGLCGSPRLGIAGAAIATVIGQAIAALVVFKQGYRPSPGYSVYLSHTLTIFRLGVPNMLMQMTCTFYILGLNLILAMFYDQAVTVLGLYYKWQTFLIIPLMAMLTCIVPIISFNYAAKNINRCKETMRVATYSSLSLMLIGTLIFELIPVPLLAVFSSDPLVYEIGATGFRIIAISFAPLVTSLLFPTFFQAIGFGVTSSVLTVLRTIVLFVPLGYFFAQYGLNWFWCTFPVTETITTAVSFLLYRFFLKHV